MASGKWNKLTGQVGEHLVSAILGTLGYYASPYSGNVPGFDITAVHADSLESFPVQVKTSTRGSLLQSTIDKWCVHGVDNQNRQHIGELKKLKHPNLIWIFVRVGGVNLNESRFFICTESDVQKKIVARYTAFMKRHDFRRPGGGASPQAVLNIKDLEEYEDNWRILPYHKVVGG